MRVLTLICLALVASLGCGEHEGDAPGECTDGADNDRDGFFDCDDQDCVFAPDCDDDRDTNDGRDTDDTGVDDTGQDGDPDPRLLELERVTVDYTLDIVFDLPIFGVEDCDMIYRGTGVSRVGAAGSTVTFEGTWAKTGGTCPSDLDPIVWTPANGEAYHSFTFTEGMAAVDGWYAHDNPEHTTQDDAEWFVNEMGQPYSHDAPSVTYVLAEPVAQIQGTLNHRVEIVFAK